MADFQKDPDSVLDYQIDWAETDDEWLDVDNDEEISTSEWIVPSGITEGTGIFASSNTTTTATIWLSGGTPGTLYKITNRIVTNASPARTADRSFRLLVTER